MVEYSFETMEEEIKDREILRITNIEEDVQDSKATNSNQPMERIRTRSMMKEEKKFQMKDQIFNT